ncbi:MAK10-like protein [Tanacetum coccineum]
MMRYFSFGRHLDELHVTWAHLDELHVGAQTETELKEKKLRATVEEGIVVGGGCTLLRLAAKVDVIKETLDNDEQKVGADIVKRALGYPMKLIAKNAGVNGSVVIEKVGPHDTQYFMENPEQAFVEYASSRTDEAREGLVSEFMASQDARLSKFEADFKRQQEEPEPTLEDEFQDLHLNLPVLEVLAHASIYKAILDKYLESLELGKSGSTFVQGEIPRKIEDPGLFTLPCRLGDLKPFDTLADLGSCVNIIPLYLFKKLNIGLLEETDHIFGLAGGTKS